MSTKRLQNQQMSHLTIPRGVYPIVPGIWSPRLHRKDSEDHISINLGIIISLCSRSLTFGHYSTFVCPCEMTLGLNPDLMLWTIVEDKLHLVIMGNMIHATDHVTWQHSATYGSCDMTAFSYIRIMWHDSIKLNPDHVTWQHSATSGSCDMIASSYIRIMWHDSIQLHLDYVTWQHSATSGSCDMIAFSYIRIMWHDSIKLHLDHVTW